MIAQMIPLWIKQHISKTSRIAGSRHLVEQRFYLNPAVFREGTERALKVDFLLGGRTSEDEEIMNRASLSVCLSVCLSNRPCVPLSICVCVYLCIFACASVLGG